MTVSTENPVADVVEALEIAAETQDQTIAEIFEEFGTTSFAAALLTVSLLLVSPLSGIPLFTSCVGATIAIISVQALLGRSQLWVPNFIGHYQLRGGRTQNALMHLRGFADWVDNQTEPRLGWVVRPPTVRALFAVTALMGLLMPTLELVPFASSIIGFGMCLVAVGIIVRDGLIAILGIFVFPVALSIPIGLLMTVMP